MDKLLNKLKTTVISVDRLLISPKKSFFFRLLTNARIYLFSEKKLRETDIYTYLSVFNDSCQNMILDGVTELQITALHRDYWTLRTQLGWGKGYNNMKQ